MTKAIELLQRRINAIERNSITSAAHWASERSTLSPSRKKRITERRKDIVKDYKMAIEVLEKYEGIK